VLNSRQDDPKEVVVLQEALDRFAGLRVRAICK
jgi:hypothetical protein